MIFSTVFLISAVLFALEILQTRIFSFSSWHHLTYMVVAVAVLGYSAAGIFLSVGKSSKNHEKFMRTVSLLFAFSIPLVFAAVSRIVLDPMMPNKLFMVLFLFCDYILLFLPHFFGGLILISVFHNKRENVNVIYFFSILGSVAGCFSALPLLESAGMEGALVAVAFCAAIPSVLIAFSSPKSSSAKFLSLFSVLFVLILFPFKNIFFDFRPAPSKFLSITGEKPEMTSWNRAGRVDVASVDRLGIIQQEWGAFQRGVITNDGDAGSLIYDFSDNRHKLAFSLYSAGYFGLSNPDVFVAGLSTTDIAAALLWQAKSVTAVEVNRAVIDLTHRKYSTFKDNILSDEKVSIIHGEVRGFLGDNPKKYDLIQLSGTDTVSALLNGAYIMSESYLYTKEAFKSYFNHLNDDGTLAVIRWLLWPPRETLKIAVTASLVLKEAGIEHPENNIVIIGDNHFASVIVKKRPFTWTELNEMSEIIAGTPDLRIIYAPGFSAGAKYYDPIVKGVNFSADQAVKFINSGFVSFFRSLENGIQNAFIKNYPYNIRPVSDDNPFFFNYFKIGGEELPAEIRNVSGDLSSFMLIILALTFVQLLFFSVSMLVTPVFFMSKEEKKFFPLLQIFASAFLGFGFMFIEMTLIQKFTLLFGDPATSAAVAIGILLSLSAIASLFSRKILILLGERILFGALMLALPLMILFYAVALPHFMALCAGTALWLKLFCTVLFVFPLGFLSGLVFPVALIIVGEKKALFIPLAFASNGAASVLATIVSVIIAMVYGFKFVFVLAAFCYFFALAAMLYFVKKRM